MAGTCGRARGQPTVTSALPGSVGSGHAASPTRLPADDPDQLSMRIAPRTMLCATDFQTEPVQESRGRFAELRELCSAAGDKVSLAIGMTGLAAELLYAGRSREGSRLASEQMALLESIGDPTLTIGLAFVAFANWFDTGEFGEILRWSQTVIDLAAGDPAKGAGFGIGSPLAIAVGISRRCSVVAGPSRVAPGPPRRRRDGPTQRPDNPRPCRRLDLRSGRYATGCFGPMTPRCARSRRRCRPPKGQQRSRTELGRVRVGCRAAVSGRRGRPSPRAGADGAGPRHVAARACCPTWSRSPSCGSPGRGPGAATAMLPLR